MATDGNSDGILLLVVRHTLILGGSLKYRVVKLLILMIPITLTKHVINLAIHSFYTGYLI